MNSIIPPQAEALKEARDVIAREVSSRYLEKKKHSGFFGRLMIWLAVQREVSREMKRRLPPHALYTIRCGR